MRTKALTILKAIIIIITTDYTKFITLSDSLSVINKIKNKTNPKTLQSLYKINSMKLKIIKNKYYSHGFLDTGIKGNEGTDKHHK